MRPHGVEVPAPVSDDDLGLGSGGDSRETQTFIAELAVEAFVHTILPGLAWFDQRRVDALIGDPFEQRARHELRAVVGAQMLGSAALAYQPGKHLAHAPRSVRPPTSIPKPSFVNSSATVRHLSWRPSAQASNTKSKAHTWFGPTGVCGRGRELAIRFRGRLRGTWSFATRHNRCARPGLIAKPSRPRKMRTR